MALSRPFKKIRLALPLSTPLSSRKNKRSNYTLGQNYTSSNGTKHEGPQRFSRLLRCTRYTSDVALFLCVSCQCWVLVDLGAKRDRLLLVQSNWLLECCSLKTKTSSSKIRTVYSIVTFYRIVLQDIVFHCIAVCCIPLYCSVLYCAPLAKAFIVTSPFACFHLLSLSVPGLCRLPEAGQPTNSHRSLRTGRVERRQRVGGGEGLR